MKSIDKIRVGYAVTGSFCTLAKSLEAAARLSSAGYSLTPIFSFNAYSIDTRFGTANMQREAFERVTGKKIIH